MTCLRTFMLLALIVWIGAIVFFPVVAHAAFAVLPTLELAGNVVSHCLTALHWMGIASATIFLVCSVSYIRWKDGRIRVFCLVHVLVFIMLVMTLVSQFGISPRLHSLREEMRSIDSISVTDTRRIEFDRLHQWSTRVEFSVLFLGLGVVVLTARRFS